MSSDWRPFVPDEVPDLLARHPGVPVALPVRRDAVVLFADVAGFTRLSEALSATGRRGTEELSRLLNGYFGRLIERIVGYGGSVVRFAGDAVIAAFPYESAGRAATVRRAVAAALDLQAVSGSYRDTATSAGSFELAMKVGIGAGPLVGVVVGDPRIRLEYVVSGSALEQAAACEHEGAPGEVLLAVDATEAGITLGERRGGARLVTGLLAPVRAINPRPPAPLPEEITERLEPFLHRPVAVRLRSGWHGLVDEHRRVSVAFVSFPPCEPDLLQRFAAAAVRVIDRYGGHLLQVDTGDKGNLLVVCFGAPTTQGDDERSAVRCCRELLGLPGGPFRAGLTTAFAYCGEVGSLWRREYLVLGDSVNLAARLMQLAEPGQLLVDERTHSRVAGIVSARAMAPVSLKGKMAPVASWDVRELTEPTVPAVAAADAFVGRERELARLHTLVDAARAGRGHIVALTGAAGVGKSRLAAETATAAVRGGFVAYRGAAYAHGTGSYLPWRPVWQQLLGLDPQQSVNGQQARVRGYIAGLDGGSEQRAPLLAPMVNVPVPDTQLTAGIDATTRSEFLRSLARDVLRARAAAGPVAIVLEDCQWMDSASAELLWFLAREIAELPILLAITSRTPADETAALHPLTGLEQFHAFALPDLAPEEAERLIESTLCRLYGPDVPLSAELLGTLVMRGGGNPFYLQELAGLLHDRGIDPRDLDAVAAVEVPDTLHSLLTARLDQLDEDEQATVKVASVIGRMFPASWVQGVYPALGGSTRDVPAHLDRLVRLDLASVDPGGAEPGYAFRHALTQEAAYGMLTFATRARLHAAVGEYVERTYGLGPQHAETLAFHYGHTEDTGKQLIWFRAAADAARATFANEVAIGHYQRLLPLLPVPERGEVLGLLGALLHLTGRWAEAENAHREAIAAASATGDRAVVARSLRDLGVLCTYRRSYDDAVTWLTRAGEEFTALGDLSGFASTLDRLAFAYFQQGRYAEALDNAQRHLDIATAAGDPTEQSAALENLGLVHAHTGDNPAAIVLLERALRLAEQNGNLRAVSFAANDLAGVYVAMGDHVRTLRYLDQARVAAERIGFRSLVAVFIGNAGELYREHGDHAAARACFQHALDIALDLGDWTSVLGQVGNLGLTAAAQGQTGAAEQALEQAVRLAREFTSPYLVCEFRYALAWLLAEQDRVVEAERQCKEALEIADGIDHPRHRLRCRLLSIRLEHAAGRIDAAQAGTRLTDLLASWPDPASQAAIHTELWQCTGTDTDRDRAAAFYREIAEHAPSQECRDQLARLGVDPPRSGPALPPLPPSVGSGEIDLRALLLRVEATFARRPGTD